MHDNVGSCLKYSSLAFWGRRQVGVRASGQSHTVSPNNKLLLLCEVRYSNRLNFANSSAMELETSAELGNGVRPPTRGPLQIPLPLASLCRGTVLG